MQESEYLTGSTMDVQNFKNQQGGEKGRGVSTAVILENLDHLSRLPWLVWAGHPMPTLHLRNQAATMFGDHRIEVVDRRVYVHGAHAIEVAVGRGEGFDALLEVAG